MSIAYQTVHGPTISDAWLSAVSAADAAEDREHGLFHLVTRIDDPVAEQPQIRAAADRLVGGLDYKLIETVANTIFPTQMAATSRDSDHLAERYRRVYPTLRRLDPVANRFGTYFGRIVAYPTPTGEHDQLAELIRRLRVELSTRGPKSARYEVSISEPSAQMPTDLTGAELSQSMHVYAAGQDASAMGFPCLSFCSFQLDRGALHMVAHYRSQYLIARGYGNYLGLGRLLKYVSDSAGLDVGELMIVAGVAKTDAPRYRINRLTEDAARS